MSYGTFAGRAGRANISMLPGGGSVMGVGAASGVPKDRGDLLASSGFAPPAPTAPVPKAAVAGRRAGGGVETTNTEPRKVGGYADFGGPPSGGFGGFGGGGANLANSGFGSPMVGGAGSMSNSAIGAPPAADTSKEDEEWQDMQKEAQMLMNLAKRNQAAQSGSESSGSTNSPRTGRTRILVA